MPWPGLALFAGLIALNYACGRLARTIAKRKALDWLHYPRTGVYGLVFALVAAPRGWRGPPPVVWRRPLSFEDPQQQE